MTRHLSRRMRARLGDSTGNTLVEAAIVTPLMLLLTFSVVDFGSLFYAYLALENGISQATRYAVTGNKKDDPDKAGSKLSREASIRMAMRQATPTLTLEDQAFAFSHRATGGNSWLAGAGGPGDIEKVTVNYPFKVLTPLLRPFFDNGQFQITVESAMKNEGRFE